MITKDMTIFEILEMGEEYEKIFQNTCLHVPDVREVQQKHWNKLLRDMESTLKNS